MLDVIAYYIFGNIDIHREKIMTSEVNRNLTAKRINQAEWGMGLESAMIGYAVPLWDGEVTW